MRLRVNGDEHAVEEEGITIAALLARLGVSEVRVAVEVNLEVVPKARYAEVHLHEGDAVEIVSFVGGG